MKLGKPTQFDMLKTIKVVPQLRNTPCAIFRLGCSCPVHGIRYHGNFYTVSYTAMKLGKPTQFDMLKKIKVVPQLRNNPGAIFRLGYSLPSPRNMLS